MNKLSSMDYQEQVRQVFIVIPTYNSERFLSQTLNSLIAQHGDFYLNIHVQDGGSSDATVSSVQRYIKQLRDKVLPTFCHGVCLTYDSAQDAGMYDAIAKGFSRFTILDDSPMGWLNSDDILMPGTIADTVKIFSQHPDVEWIGSSYASTMGEDGSRCDQCQCYYPQVLLAQGLCDGEYWPFLQQEGIFWRSKLYNKVGGLNVNLRYAGDWDLWRKFASQSPIYLCRWPRGLFRIVKNQLSAQGSKYQDEMNAIVDRGERAKRAEDALENGHLRALAFYFNSSTGEFGLLDPHVVDGTSEHWAWTKIGQRLQLRINEEHEARDRYYDQLSVENEYVKKQYEIVSHAYKSKLDAERKSWLLKFMDIAVLHILYNKSPKRMQRILTFLKYKILKPVIERPSLIKRTFQLKRSGLFWPTYYNKMNPDVKQAKICPYKHYILFGALEGRKPNPLFDTAYYCYQNADVKFSKVNPLIHFYQYGWVERRDPSEDFSVSAYLDSYPELLGKKINPLTHRFYSL